MSQPEARRPQILVVDDDPTQLLLAVATLSAYGFEAHEAADGVEGLERARALTPDLIVSDALMPRCDGFAMCAALRQDPQLRHTPLLMVTGLEDSASIDRAFDHGATDFVSKPINWPLLAHRVRFQLRVSQIEREMRQAKEAAEAGSRAKSEFLASISHELRTPLNAVIGFAEVMEMQTFGPLGDARYGNYVSQIALSGQRLLAVINDILDLVNVQSGRLDLDDQPVDVVALLEETLEARRASVDPAMLAISLVAPPDAPLISGDARRLRQAFDQIIANAVKFTPAGGAVKISVIAESADALRIEIADTGIGIAADDLPKVFEPFRQVDGRLSRKFEGAGLGLPLAAAFIRAHGGALTIDSAPGAGTRIAIRLGALRLAA